MIFTVSGVKAEKRKSDTIKFFYFYFSRPEKMIVEMIGRRYKMIEPRSATATAPGSDVDV
jgi:hypothetical protein